MSTKEEMPLKEELREKLRHRTVSPLLDIWLRASFYSASHFSTKIQAREFVWPLKRHTALYRLSGFFRGANTCQLKEECPVGAVGTVYNQILMFNIDQKYKIYIIYI